MRWVPAVACSLAFAVAALVPAAARAQDDPTRLSRPVATRPYVLPSLVWSFEGGAEVRRVSGQDVEVVAPNLGARVGVPRLWILPAGMELAANLLPLVLSGPNALAWAPSVTLAQRIFPLPAYPIQGVMTEPFELTAELRWAVDPFVAGLPFRFDGALPMVFRAPSVLRVDVVPRIGFVALDDRGAFATTVRALVSPLDELWLAVSSGIDVPDVTDWGGLRVPLGAEVGVTIHDWAGPVVDVVAEGGFVRLYDGAVNDTDLETLRFLLTLRVFTYWDLDATDPGDPIDRDRCERCGEGPCS